MARTKKVWSWSPEQVTALAALMKTHTEMSLNGRPGAAYTESQFIDRVKGRRASEGTEAIKGFYPRIQRKRFGNDVSASRTEFKRITVSSSCIRERQMPKSLPMD